MVLWWPEPALDYWAGPPLCSVVATALSGAALFFRCWCRSPHISFLSVLLICGVRYAVLGASPPEELHWAFLSELSCMHGLYAHVLHALLYCFSLIVLRSLVHFLVGTSLSPTLTRVCWQLGLVVFSLSSVGPLMSVPRIAGIMDLDPLWVVWGQRDSDLAQPQYVHILRVHSC